jgi:hypothetical protein
MGQFITNDCAECGEPQISLEPCEFCGAGFCTDTNTYADTCWNRQPQCVDCRRKGCRSHFDGMFCLECISAEDRRFNAAGREGES